MLKNILLKIKTKMEKINVVKLTVFSVAVAVSCVAVAFAVTRVNIATPDALAIYEAERQLILDQLVPQREAILYELAAKEQDIADAEIRLCIAELHLAQAKLTDHFNGVLPLGIAEVERLTAKLSMECGMPMGEEPLPKIEKVNLTKNLSSSRKSNNSIVYAESVESSRIEFGAKLSQAIVNQESKIDLDKLAYAVSMAETSGCTKGTALAYNNCFGIKNGSIAPCSILSRGGFCIYDAKSQSFAAFKKIWKEGYGGKFPNKEAAAAWTGNDNPVTWLKNVNHYYYSF